MSDGQRAAGDGRLESVSGAAPGTRGERSTKSKPQRRVGVFMQGVRDGGCTGKRGRRSSGRDVCWLIKGV